MKKEKSIEEIKQEYPLLGKMSDVYTSILYEDIIKEQLITEFLSTVPALTTAKSLHNFLRKKEIEAKLTVRKEEGIAISEKTLLVLFPGPLQKKYVDITNDYVDKFGWYPSAILGPPSSPFAGVRKYSTAVHRAIGFPGISILYEAKYNIKIEKVPEKLIHITPDIVWPSIRYKGLTPKSKSKLTNHPERIYLMYPVDKHDMDSIAYMLWGNYKERDRVEEMFVLIIKTSSIPDVEFYQDPNFLIGDGAVWTYQNIPPSAIQLVKKIPIDKDLF